MGAEERLSALSTAVAHRTREGWRVEATVGYSVTLVRGHRPNHVLHALLSLFTLGLWLPAWAVVAAATRERRVTLAVDDFGQVALRA